MSEMSDVKSLLMSAGQAFAPHWTRALVPAAFSTAELKLSQSGSLGAMGQGGGVWPGFAQVGQLSETSGAPSLS